MSTHPPSRTGSAAARERADAALAWTRARLGARGITRPRRGRLVAGVLAGLARRFGVRPAALRVAFLISMVLPGPQFVAYVVLWVLMPPEGA